LIMLVLLGKHLALTNKLVYYKIRKNPTANVF